MANTIKKGESLFIPFKNGESIYDSQLKPRMYKTKEQYDRFSYRFDDAEMVEYAEVVRCKNCTQWNCVTKPKLCDKRHGYCLNDDEPIGRWEDDFCSYGERKDNERKAD